MVEAWISIHKKLNSLWKQIDDKIDLAVEEIWKNGEDFNSVKVYYRNKLK